MMSKFKERIKEHFKKLKKSGEYPEECICGSGEGPNDRKHPTKKFPCYCGWRAGQVKKKEEKRKGNLK
jgi:hypothetical protein